MPCPVHANVGTDYLTHKDITPREERAVREKMNRLSDILQDWHDDLLATLESGTVDLRRRAAIRRALESTLDNHREEIDVSFRGMWIDGHDLGRELAIQQYDLGISFDLSRPEVEDALRTNAFVASEATKGRMVGDISEALATAYSEGLSIPDIAQRLEDDVFQSMRGYESERIARTEVVSASNKGGHEAYVDGGAIGEEWLTAVDGRERPSHREANGQVVPIRDAFIVGGNRAEYPGDPALPISERAQCRCSSAPVWDPDRLSA